MTRRRFKLPRKQEAYALARRYGADTRSGFYTVDGEPLRDGWGDYYWSGRLGETGPEDATRYIYWRAGADDRVQIDKLPRGRTWREAQDA